MPPTTAAGLPPGPRLPALAQTLGFVMVFDPELVCALFRGRPERLRAGEANAL